MNTYIIIKVRGQILKKSVLIKQKSLNPKCPSRTDYTKMEFVFISFDFGSLYMCADTGSNNY